MSGYEQIINQQRGGFGSRVNLFAGGNMTARMFFNQIKLWIDAAMFWLVWAGRIVLAIGICYLALSLFAMDNINIGGQNWRIIPKVLPDHTKLVYLAASIFLWARTGDLK